MKIELTVDGAAVSDDVEPRMLLVQYLREKLGKTGTVIGCDTSNCGACTVHLDGTSVKSCNVLAVQANGRTVTTIEGLANGDTLLIQGPPGVGKSHLAVALGREAVRQGYSVLFTPAMALIANLMKGQAEGRLEERLARYAKPKLLIVDEFGYLPLEPHAAHLFFALVSRRYERGSLLVTSNRSVSEWGTVLNDAVVATAILDRLLHHSHVLTIRGDSYRLREKRRSGLLKSNTAPAPAGASA